MAKLDPQVLAHLEWLGFVRPTGLVVSAPALVRAGAILEQRDAEGQRLLRACVGTAETGADRVGEAAPRYGGGDTNGDPRIDDFRAFAASVLGWCFSPKGYAGTAESPIPPELEVPLPDAGETLRPDYAVRELEPQDGAPPWQLLVRVLTSGEDFDTEARGVGRLELSPQSRMERLLRQTGVPAGLLVNGHGLRLVSAPRGESSGWLDFRVADMVQTAGRPIASALRLLVSERRLLALPRHQRLAALLADSRRFQNEVSEKLAEQVLHALYELLRGFQAAHDATKGELLRQVLADHPDQVYRALLTVILRLVFLLYAEERDMLPQDETFLRSYSLAGLHERLREDSALYPDTMEQRFGAWAQLVALFRMVHDGAAAPGMRLPQRHGVLFDPDRFPFLEGRTAGGVRQIHERIVPPLVPDGTVYRALEKLLVLDGERISYRALDVEQIGSVYETMMGFRLETATGRSVAIRSQKKHGAPTTVDLDALLAEAGAGRPNWIEARADRKLTDKLKKSVAATTTLEDLHAALLPAIDPAATPDLVPQGAMVLQPSEERRRSGSHYTPRELTEPIVRTTLEPILARLRGKDGVPPRPEAILDLKACDPAMGSGAFLVEACRYLADALVESWRAHDARPAIPPDEDEVVYARRLVAQRCLYGVDRNPVAVDLAKMSLWLATLAKDHALTFVDHALRHGDSLVGLSRRQIEAFHWAADAPKFQAGFEATKARERLAKVRELRRRIRDAGEGASDGDLRDLWDKAQIELGHVRLLGDLAVAAWFEGERPKEREAKRVEFATAVANGTAERWRGWLEERRHADPPLAPFHWDIEFPEVFDRELPGFDALVGNPPFLGGTKIEPALGKAWRAWIVANIAKGRRGIRGAADLCCYFFLRSYQLIHCEGVFGLVATNTISQGDSRDVGLQQICDDGGVIFYAHSSTPWPGEAALEIAQVCIKRGTYEGPRLLDGAVVKTISPFLSGTGAQPKPRMLAVNSGKAFEGAKLIGDGFIIDNDEAAVLIDSDPRVLAVVRPFLSGKDINDRPDSSPSRYAINFLDYPLTREDSADKGPSASDFPQCLEIVRRRVLPERLNKTADSSWNRYIRDRWWQFALWRPALVEAIRDLKWVFAVSRVSKYLAVVRARPNWIFSDATVVFALESFSAFSLLQSQSHDNWARRYGSTLEDRSRYTPSSCFQTFPFPENWETHPALEAAGQAYYDFRAALMVRNGEGLTKTYNRFHNPDEHDPDILKLRELHAATDRAVLDVYGWRDLVPTCEFLLNFEIDEEEWGDKKKPYRYRWSDDVQAEVLARLLELNAERARAEARSGAAAEGKRGPKKSARSAAPNADKGGLFS